MAIRYPGKQRIVISNIIQPAEDEKMRELIHKSFWITRITKYKNAVDVAGVLAASKPKDQKLGSLWLFCLKR